MPLWRRLATTVALALLPVVGERIRLPSLDGDSAFLRQAPSTATTSVFALGVTPFLSAYLAVEVAALLVPRWRKLRHENPEGRRLLTDLTVQDNLRVATYALSRADATTGIEYALELFPELQKRWDIQARLLSGGEQQMLVLAQALVSQPKIVLVDELALGLAPVIVKRLVPTIAKVAESGVGVLLIEQFAHVALGLAEKAYVIEGGRIHYEGTAQRLKDEPEILRSAYLLRGTNVD